MILNFVNRINTFENNYTLQVHVYKNIQLQTNEEANE